MPAHPRNTQRHPWFPLITQHRLVYIHTVALITHILSCVCLFITSHVRRSSRPVEYPLYNYRSTFDQETLSTHPSGWEAQGFVSLPVVVMCFTAAAVVAEGAFVFLLGGCGHTRWTQRFEEDIRRGCNPLRWVEYFFSASIMIAIIAYFCGITDVPTITCVMALVATTQCFGGFTEQWNRHRRSPCCQRLWPHFLGWVPQLVAWWIIISRFVRADADTGHNMPSFVRWIVAVEAVLFSSFGMVQLYEFGVVDSQRDQGVWADGMYGILSLTSKTLLAWIVFSQVLI
jgi:hypothetical protein